jgi:plastocyanin
MRRLALTVGLALGILAGPGAVALAVDQDVQATSSATFSPKSVTINAGETVRWHNSSGLSHNVDFDDGSGKVGGDPVTHNPSGEWDAQFTFNTPGTFAYHCDMHGGTGGAGMSGKVTVLSAGGGDTTPPVVTKLKAKPSPFCNKKSSNCKKPGTRVTFKLSEAASVEADVTNVKTGTGPVIVFHKQGKAGKNSVKFSGKAHGKRLKRAKYSLRLIATDAAGNRSSPAIIRIRIRK